MEFLELLLDLLDLFTWVGGVEPPSPLVWKCLVVVMLGGGLGWCSVQVWPHLLLMTAWLRMANVVAAPVALGFGSYGLLQRWITSAAAWRWAAWITLLAASGMMTRWIAGTL